MEVISCCKSNMWCISNTDSSRFLFRNRQHSPRDVFLFAPQKVCDLEAKYKLRSSDMLSLRYNEMSMTGYRNGISDAPMVEQRDSICKLFCVMPQSSLTNMCGSLLELKDRLTSTMRILVKEQCVVCYYPDVATTVSSVKDVMMSLGLPVPRTLAISHLDLMDTSECSKLILTCRSEEVENMKLVSKIPSSVPLAEILQNFVAILPEESIKGKVECLLAHSDPGYISKSEGIGRTEGLYSLLKYLNSTEDARS